MKPDTVITEVENSVGKELFYTGGDEGKLILNPIENLFILILISFVRNYKDMGFSKWQTC